MRIGFLSIAVTLVTLNAQIVEALPPAQIPQKLYQDFTLQDQIPVSHWYRNDSYAPSTPVVWTKNQIDSNMAQIAQGQLGYYGLTDEYLYSALKKYTAQFQGKTVAIIGSVTPWYESIVLCYGGKPTTIEYNKIITNDPRLEVMTVKKFEKKPKLFDAILSVSSIEHDGLGRYGDPINPDGDLWAMKKMKGMLKKNGLLLLSIPVGEDRLWWNVHRIYGKIRFPMLLKGWNLIDSFGFKNSDFDTNQGIDAWKHQPVFVLKPSV